LSFADKIVPDGEGDEEEMEEDEEMDEEDLEDLPLDLDEVRIPPCGTPSHVSDYKYCRTLPRSRTRKTINSKTSKQQTKNRKTMSTN
jgi:hypothetical protein